MPLSTAASIFRFMKSLLRARLDGSYKINPFFVPGKGVPVRPVKVLTRDEWEQVMKAV